MEERNAVTLSSPLSPQTNPVPCRRGWDSGPPGWTETRPPRPLWRTWAAGVQIPPGSLSLSLGGDWKWVAFIAHTEYCCLNGVAVRLATNAFTDSCRPSNACQMKFASLFFKRTWNYNEPFLKKYLWFDFAQFSAFYSWKCSSFYTSNTFFLA